MYLFCECWCIEYILEWMNKLNEYMLILQQFYVYSGTSLCIQTPLFPSRLSRLVHRFLKIHVYIVISSLTSIWIIEVWILKWVSTVYSYCEEDIILLNLNYIVIDHVQSTVVDRLASNKIQNLTLFVFLVIKVNSC